jgi:hypothetical protein
MVLFIRGGAIEAMAFVVDPGVVTIIADSPFNCAFNIPVFALFIAAGIGTSDRESTFIAIVK